MPAWISFVDFFEKHNPMQKFKIPALLVLISLLPACSSHQPITSENIQRMEPGIPGNAFYYALPRTVIVIDVEVRETTKTPGPYAAFAGSFLGLEDVIFSHAKHFEISGISVNAFTEPDPDHLYYVTVPDETPDFFLSMCEAGIIYSMNKAGNEDRTGKPIANGREFRQFDAGMTFHYDTDGNLMEQADASDPFGRTDTLNLKRQTLRRSWIEKGLELRAREVADYIMEIREKKFDLISGFQEINYSKEALEYMYSEMDRLEGDYLDLFTGIVSTRTKKYRFIHRPIREEAASRHNLFGFSTSNGVLGTSEGIPVSISYQRSRTSDALQQQIRRHADNRRRTGKGLHHRIPEYADVVIHLGTEKIAESRKIISQFGIVTHLPPANKAIEFHPQTGSIKSAGDMPEQEQ